MKTASVRPLTLDFLFTVKFRGRSSRGQSYGTVISGILPINDTKSGLVRRVLESCLQLAALSHL